jgi:peptidoglycan-N-acetylglucosamine deacetylase
VARTGRFGLILLVGVLLGACGSPVPPSSPSATGGSSSRASPAAGPSGSSASPVPSNPCSVGCAQPAVFVHHGSRTGSPKVVALTFDDGFNIPACISIVGTLLQKGVTATFFPNGQYVRENPGFWHWVATLGFPLGNHTTTHHDPTSLSAQDLALNLDSDRRILDETTGRPSIDVFRPPYGSSNELVEQVAANAGYPLIVGWDVDSKDQTGAPSVAAEVANATKGTNGSIVLMHCGSPLTPLALPAIIASYAGRGFSFVTIPQMFSLPEAGPGWTPPTDPDPQPAQQLAPGDPSSSWNASPAFDAVGHLHLAYESPFGITYGDDDSGGWQSSTIALSTESTFVSRPSIALDPSGGVHLVYLASTIAGTQLLYQERPAGGGAWTSPVSVAKLPAPASTATIAIDPSGRPVIAFALTSGAHAGITLARLTPAGWTQVHVPGTNGTFIGPSIAIDAAGAIHLVERRNGRSEVDQTTNASGTWATSRLVAVPASAVPYAAFEPDGRLVVAVQPLFGSVINLGIGFPAGQLAWSTVTNVGDLSGLAIGPGGKPEVAFSRVVESGGPSRIWLASVAP